MKKKILIIVLLTLLLFIIGLTIFLYNYSGEETIEYIKTIKLISEKKNIIYSEASDKNTYGDKIVTKYDNKLDYTFYDNNKSIIGKIYIDNDKKLYITSDNDNDVIKVSNTKFTKLYSDENAYKDGIYIYLISENNKLYYFSLNSNNIKNAKIEEINTKYNVLDFTNVNFDNDMLPSSTELFVLESDNNIYDIYSGIRYKEGIKKVFNSIIIFEDKTMANLYGKILQDSDGRDYKAKYIFSVKSNKNYFDYDSLIIITEDNKLLSILSNDNYNYVYEDISPVKNVNFDQKMPFVNGKINIELGDDRKLSFEGKCSAYYCINEFDLEEKEDIIIVEE